MSFNQTPKFWTYMIDEKHENLITVSLTVKIENNIFVYDCLVFRSQKHVVLAVLRRDV